jgi:hypothetical protein
MDRRRDVTKLIGKFFKHFVANDPNEFIRKQLESKQN